jgi:serine/threonine-protein kinase RsbW
VRQAAGELGAGRHAIDDLVQAVDEAACNVVLYGYHGKSGPLEVSVGRRGEAIEVTLRDAAPPFDPLSVPEPDPDPRAGPKAWGRSGQGLHLLRSMTDEVHHRARPGGGNELTLIRGVHRPGEED